MSSIRKGDKVNGGNEVLWTRTYGEEGGNRGTAADPLVHYKDSNGNTHTDLSSKVKKD